MINHINSNQKELLVMMLNGVGGLFAGLKVSSVLSPKKLLFSKTGKYNKLGLLKVHSTVNSSYLKDFLVPYMEFEDLHNCNIKVRFKKLKTTMAARPNFFTLLLGKRNRRYVILINSDKSFSGVQLKDIPSNARIGLFAHELMHVRDYESFRIAGVIKRGIQYLSHKGKTKIEHHTDSLTIDAGFGQNLYQWASYVLHHSDASEDYKTYKSKVYMTPLCIKTQMQQLHI